MNPSINTGPSGFLEGICDGKPANGFEPMAFALRIINEPRALMQEWFWGSFNKP
jgi:hypothetical protein